MRQSIEILTHWRKVDPTTYLDYRVYLQTLYHLAKTTRPRYSYEQMAQDLGFSKNNFLAHVIAGRRPLSSKAAKTIANTLHLNQTKKNYLLTLVSYLRSKDSAKQEVLFRKLLELRSKTAPELSKDQIDFFSEWHHIALCQYLEIPDAPQAPEEIAKKLQPNLRPEQVKRATDLLCRLGLIYYDTGEKRWRRTMKNPSTEDEVRDISLASFHRQMIDLGKAALSDTNAAQREVSAVTITISRNKVQKIKNLIQDFERVILSEETKTPTAADQVYQLNVQLFPLSE